MLKWLQKERQQQHSIEKLLLRKELEQLSLPGKVKQQQQLLRRGLQKQRLH